MARRHHRRPVEENLEWVGVSQCGGDSGQCAMYFYNFHSTNNYTVDIAKTGSSPNIQLEYSTNGSTWTSFTTPASLSVQHGGYLYLRSASGVPTGFSNISTTYHISNSGPMLIGGNIKSLLCKYWNKNITLSSNCFRSLFDAEYHSQNNLALTQWVVGSSNSSHIDFVMPFEQLADSCYKYMFRGAGYDPGNTSYNLNYTGSITQATGGVLFLQGDMTNAPGCFSHMFYGCSSYFSTRTNGCINMKGITGTMPAAAFANMFANCTQLMLAKSVLDELDWYFGGGGISESGMNGMFAGCSNLTHFEFSSWAETQFPIKYKGVYWDGSQDNYDDIYMDIYESKFPVNNSGMANMFSECAGLSEAWLPPYAVVGYNAYYNMYYSSGATCLSYFHGNPILPAGIEYVSGTHFIANNLGDGCYQGMFNGCGSLMEAPILPSMNLASSCYREMFYNCTNILYIKMLGILTDDVTYTYNWLYGCAKNAAGGAVMVVSGTSTGANSWNISGESGCPTGWTMYNTYTEPLWIKNIGSTTPTMTLTKASSAPTIYVRWWTESNQAATDRTLSATTSTGISIPRWRRLFVSAALSSNNSKLGGGGTSYYWRFTSSTTATGTALAVGGQLSTMLRYNGLANSANTFNASYCLQSVFNSLTVLRYAQELGVNNYSMLSGGKLPNYSYTYYRMFSGCTGLKYPPTHIGKFYSTGSSSRYQAREMFYNCTALRESPIIASEIVNINNCYRMFYCATANAGHLKKITALFTNEPSNSSNVAYGTYQWVQNQAQEGIFYKANDAEWDVSGAGGVPTTFDTDISTYRPKFTSYQPNWIYYLVDRKRIPSS